ncbi:hypothetical protein XELAEV_18044952mg [Xenopus laevis]|uniref:Uncharacterized protein n=1 Tax=Xenopus laevis TaxID=8355 RepID=A0A974H484_XENLA|nr:hypothetical protein XELAEV_18044952mg [Xenopus laevis]
MESGKYSGPIPSSARVHIRYQGTDTSVSRHFFECKHNPMQLRWCVIDEAPIDSRGDNRLKRLLQKEGKWIKKLGTLIPDGLNDSWSLKPYL